MLLIQVASKTLEYSTIISIWMGTHTEHTVIPRECYLVVYGDLEVL